MAQDIENRPDEQQTEESSESRSDQPEIQIRIDDAGTLKKKITVTVPAERITSKQDEMLGELSRTAQVPGFRIGRAPRRLLEKRFGKEVAQDVRNAIIAESLGDAIEKSQLKTLGEPDLDLDKIELPETGDLTYDFEVEIEPQFELPQLEGIEVVKPVVVIDDARVDQTLEQWRQGQARYEQTDQPAAEGDMVLAAATIRGQDVAELHKPGLQLRVAPGQIEGLPLIELGKVLSGKKAGDSASLEVTVPQAHPNEQWRGKNLTVEIEISQVRKRILPQLDDQFAAAYGFDSIEQLRGQVRRSLETRVNVETQRAMRSQICRYLLENTQFDLPEGLVARHTGQVLKRRYIELLYQGIPREQIDERLTELQAAATEQAQQDLKLSFILAKIAEQFEIQVTAEQVNARVAEMARQYNRRPERLRQELAQDGTLTQVESAIREEIALDRLLEKAKITEQQPGEPAEKKKAGKKKASKSKAAKAKATTRPKASKKKSKTKKKSSKSES